LGGAFLASAVGPQYAPAVRAFALVELGDSEAIDLFLREEDARRSLEDCLADESACAGILQVWFDRVGGSRHHKLAAFTVERKPLMPAWLANLLAALIGAGAGSIGAVITSG